MSEYLTTRELSALLRVKERKIYDLAASGEVPCTKVTGKLLFPEREVREWLANGRLNLHRTGTGAGSEQSTDRPADGSVAQAAAQAGAQAAVQAAVQSGRKPGLQPGLQPGSVPLGSAQGATEFRPIRPGVFLGSHDPLLDWALRESLCTLATYLDGSLDGLERFIAHEGLACGLHVYNSEPQDWNISCVSEQCSHMNVVLVHFAKRQRGLIVHPDASISSLQELSGQRIVPRQVSSGAHSLLAHLLAEEHIDMQSLQQAPLARNESDAVLSIVEGHADAAFGLEALAHQHRLRFVPLIEESFDLLIDRKAFFDQPIQTLLTFCRSVLFVERANELQGYDVSETGVIRWNA